MENKAIPTAEELYYQFKGSNVNISKKQFIEAVKYSNTLHVQAALEAALEEVPYGSSTDTVSYTDVSGILTCYPLEHIK